LLARQKDAIENADAEFRYHSKIGDVQRDKQFIILNRKKVLDCIVCILTPIAHSSSSNEETEEDDSDNDFWHNPDIFYSNGEESTEDDCDKNDYIESKKEELDSEN
jgi:hypothetical protein